jgi:[3-methyl-2-oxobutanoate dehydrogenase (acetyl-transferring)] kinase
MRSLSYNRISDRGGGIPHNKIAKVMQYSFSTAEESTEQLMDEDVFGNLMEACNRTTSGPMHGYVV